MMIFQMPAGLALLYPKRIWKGPDLGQKVTLTFDDGPVPGITDWVVEELAKRALTATFFMVGDNVRKHPSLAQEVVAAGHQLGNHTYHHLSGWKASTKTYLEDVAACDFILEDTLGVQTDFFRPPYGWISPGQPQALSKQKTIAMWSLLSYDFDSSLAIEASLQKCKAQTKPGAILVFHDQEKTKDRLRKILPSYLDFLVSEGFETQGL